MKKRKLRKIPNGEENVKREIQLLQSLDHRNTMLAKISFWNIPKMRIISKLRKFGTFTCSFDQF